MKERGAGASGGGSSMLPTTSGRRTSPPPPGTSQPHRSFLQRARGKVLRWLRKSFGQQQQEHEVFPYPRIYAGIPPFNKPRKHSNNSASCEPINLLYAKELNGMNGYLEENQLKGIQRGIRSQASASHTLLHLVKATRSFN